MRKSKKTLAILAIIAMVLMMIPVQAFADNASATNRLFGDTRVDTAIAIANNGWANGASNVVVVPANDENLVDALAVAPLAKQLNAPILITDKAGLDAKVAAEIAALKATNVYAVGALSDAVATSLKAISGATVTTIKGADRFQTAAQVAAKLTSPAGTFVVAYNGLADALSAASFAAANGYAILVADTNGSLPASESVVGSKTYTVGGQVAAISGATSFAGADRYATNDAVIKGLGFKYDKVFVANGESLVDALPGSVLAAQTNSPIVLANTSGAAAAADVKANLTASSQVVAFGGTAVVPDAVVGSISGTAPAAGGTVAVSSVKATAANQIQVTFGAAPADTSKVVFAVQNSGSPMTVTTAWDSTNTVATLTYDANFPQGDYTVNVKNDTTDLGTSNISFTQQQVAKIQVTSTVLSVDPNPYTAGDSTTTGYGYATYKVFDQYGADVTNAPLGNNVTWTPGIGTLLSASNGVIIIKPTGSIPLTSYANCVINAYDATSYVTSSSTLSVSQATGTLSSITLNKLTSPTNDSFDSSDTTGQWFIDYSATDASGNPTTSYALINAGYSQITAPYLVAKVIQDPNDSTKAAIQVTLDTSLVGNIVADMQVPITMVLKNGKTSTLNVTLKKGAALNNISLSAPTSTATSASTVTIPFTAFDQNGTAITKFSDLDGNVTLTNSGVAGADAFKFVAQPDGTALLRAKMPTLPSGLNTMTVYLNATVKSSGKMSQLNITVQKASVPTTLSLSSTKLIQAMQIGSTQAIDFGYNYGGLTVKDQYGKSYDMDDVVAGGYKVIATPVSANGILQITQKDRTKTDGTNNPAQSITNYVYVFGGNSANIKALKAGTETVKFALEDASGNVIDTQSQILTVVNSDDIKGYTLSTPSTLYAQSTGGSTDFDQDYASTLKVYGTLSNGNKVLLCKTFKIGDVAANPSVQTTINATSSSSDFLVTAADDSGYSATTSSYVYAKKYDLTTNPGKTTGSGTITVLVNGTDGMIHTLTASVSSSSDSPKASSLDYYVDETLLASSSNDVVTLKHAQVSGKCLTYVNPVTKMEDGNAVYFFANDQYGTQDATVTLYISSQALTGGTASIDPTTNVLNLGGATDGTVTITAVTKNGLAKSITLNIQHD